MQVLAVKNSSAEAAMDWLLNHMGDANLNDPIEDTKPAAPAKPAAAAPAPAPVGPKVDEAAIAQVQAVLEGIPVARIRHALEKTVSVMLSVMCFVIARLIACVYVCVQNNDVARAIDYTMNHMDDPLPDESTISLAVCHNHTNHCSCVCGCVEQNRTLLLRLRLHQRSHLI